MDIKNFNGVDYHFDQSKVKITWTKDKMNYEINLHTFGQRNDIAQGFCEYSAFINNKDLLIESGLTEQQAEATKHVFPIKEIKGQVTFVISDPSQVTLTVADINKFMNEIAKRHLGFAMYDENGQLL